MKLNISYYWPEPLGRWWFYYLTVEGWKADDFKGWVMLWTSTFFDAH